MEIPRCKSVKNIIGYALFSLVLLNPLTFSGATLSTGKACGLAPDKTPHERVKAYVDEISTLQYGKAAKEKHQYAVSYAENTRINEREKATMILAAHNNYSELVEKAVSDILNGNSCNQKKLKELNDEMKDLIKLKVKNSAELQKFSKTIEFYNEIRRFVYSIKPIKVSKVTESYNVDFADKAIKRKTNYLSKEIKCNEIKNLLQRELNKRLNSRQVSFIDGLVKQYESLVDGYINDSSGEYEKYDDKHPVKNELTVDHIYSEIEKYHYKAKGAYAKYGVSSAEAERVTERIITTVEDYDKKRSKEEERRKEERLKREEEERIRKEKEEEEAKAEKENTEE